MWKSLLAVWMFVTVSCMQRETGIGSDAITDQPQQEFRVIGGTATRSAQWHPQLSNGVGQSLAIGRAAGFDASFGIRFWPSTILPDSAQVDSMELVLRRANLWPSTVVEPLGIRIREITEDWDESAVSDSLFGNRGNYPVVDSLRLFPFDTLLTYQIPDSLAQRWLSSDSTTRGLLFEPTSSGVLIDFYSSEAASSYRVTLKMWGVQWSQQDGEWQDTLLYLEIPNTDPPNNAQIQDVYVAQETLAVTPGRLSVSQGSHRRFVLYFPLDSILADPALTVVRAELRVYIDSLDQNNVNMTPAVSPLFTHGSMSDTLWLSNPDSAKGGDYSRTSTSISSGYYYGFDASSLVANWVYLPERNRGVQVLAADEIGPLGRQIFHSPLSEDSTKRPRLLVWIVESR